MSNEKPFKASNGLLIEEIDEDDYMITSPSGVEINVDPYQSKALREYFQHERDQQLGRVRWPENPDVVIYRDPDSDDEDGRCVRIVDEQASRAIAIWEQGQHLVGYPPLRHRAAARWYFTEGPGKEPERSWEEAATGEVWRLTVDGEERNAVAEKSSAGNAWFSTPDNYISAANPDITAGRKLLEADGSVAE